MHKGRERPLWGKEKPPYKGSFLHGGSVVLQQGTTAKEHQHYESYQIERRRAIHHP